MLKDAHRDETESLQNYHKRLYITVYTQPSQTRLALRSHQTGNMGSWLQWSHMTIQVSSEADLGMQVHEIAR